MISVNAVVLIVTIMVLLLYSYIVWCSIVSRCNCTMVILEILIKALVLLVLVVVAVLVVIVL